MKLGNKRCFCSACKNYFNSVSAFDKHRKGDYKNEGANRHCDTKGMFKNKDGYWVTELRI
jgi:hypothetical protein